MKAIWRLRATALALLLAATLLVAGCDYVAQMGDASLYTSVSNPQAQRFLQDAEKSGLLSRDDVQAVGLERMGDVVVVKLWLKETDGLETRRIEEMQRMSSRLSAEVFDGAPVEIRFMDSQGKVFQRIVPRR